MSALQFFLEGIKNIRTVGTISRSSQFVSKTMIKHVDFNKSKCIVEMGAGDGPITKHILNAMKPGTKLLAFEVNPLLCELLRKRISDDRLVLIEDSVENLGKYLDMYGFDKADYIISAIPFVALPDDLGDRILETAKDCLRKGGRFIQINYSLIARKRYEKVFGNSHVKFVPLNIPPAFISICEN